MAINITIPRVTERALRAFLQEDISQPVAGRKSNFRIKIDKVIAFYERGQWEQAIRTLREMLGMGDDKKVLVGIGWAQRQLERYDEALDTYDQVIERWPDVAEVWVLRYQPLVGLERLQEAIESLEEAYSRRHTYSPSFIWSLYFNGAFLWLHLGVKSIEVRSLPDLENATKAFIMWQERASRDKQGAAFREALEVTKENLTAEESAAYEEFMLSVRLGSIEDPFDRWKELGKEISKVWPKGVSAVDAIREQRE